MWPDFTDADFEAALHDYANRERRFGAVKQAV
jgi:undecaprenyl pyrophosphate synthase